MEEYMDIEISKERIFNIATQCIKLESAAISNLKNFLGDEFITAVKLLLNCKGHVVVMGIGKSGHIAAKIAATLASTGTHAFFLHPTEAAHGDLGMMKTDDIAIILSHSGETDEVINILPILKDIGVRIISITSRQDSTVGDFSEVVLNTGVQKEADPRGLAPTSSAIASLAFGDALAMAVSVERGFSNEDFLRYHPGGSLGKKAK